MAKMDVKAFRARIEGVDTLATIPAVLKKLLTIIENPRVSLAEISQFISGDPVLATKVLRMVNSPVYGFPGRISSVNQAVILLGLNVVKGLLFGVTVFDLMQKSMVGLWEHSLGCAIVARLMAKRKGLKEPEEASVFGLLHDIGKVILILRFPSDYQAVINLSGENRMPIYDAERELFAADHAAVGGWLARKWRFPANLTETIEFHHKPSLSRGIPLETAIIHVADIMVRARGYGFAGDSFVPVVNPAAWSLLDLPKPDMREILKEMEDSLEETGDLTP